MKPFLAGVFCLIIVSANSLHAETTQKTTKDKSSAKVTSYFSGNDMVEVTKGKKEYIWGIIDGIRLSPLMSNNSETYSKIDQLETCIRGMSGAQLVAIFDKYLEDNPSAWHYHANILVFNSLVESCSK